MFIKNIAIISRPIFSVFCNNQQQPVNKLFIRTMLSYYSTEALEGRYKDKLLQEAQKQGFTTVDELKKHLKDDLKSKRKEISKIAPSKELQEYEQRVKMSSNPTTTNYKRAVDATKPVTPFKTLDAFLNLEKIEELSKQEIEFLWRAKWANKDMVLSAVVPVDIYKKIITNARANPIFVLPLPRVGADNEEQGIELHYIQWQFVGLNTVHCIMTSLAEFKLHNEFARPHTTFQFHSELAKEKKVVLMNGQVESETNISLQDAQLLLLNVQRFYGAMGEETPSSKKRVQLLRNFTNGSPDFNVDFLIAMAQSMEN